MREPLEKKAARYEDARARDRKALRIMAERGISIAEAYRELMDAEDRYREVAKVAPLFAGKI